MMGSDGRRESGGSGGSHTLSSMYGLPQNCKRKRRGTWVCIYVFAQRTLRKKPHSKAEEISMNPVAFCQRCLPFAVLFPTPHDDIFHLAGFAAQGTPLNARYKAPASANPSIRNSRAERSRNA